MRRTRPSRRKDIGVTIFRIVKRAPRAAWLALLRALGRSVFKMKSDYIRHQELLHILSLLTEPNRLACEISLYTGLRIGDVLSLKADRVKEKFTIREEKTGKRRVVRLSRDLLDRCHREAGRVWVFEGRLDPYAHRTRQAVYRDIKRAAAAYRLPGRLQISPHSCRKVYAVRAIQQGASLAKVQQLLNHSDEAVTMLYAMADRLTARKMGWHDDGLV